MSKFAAIVILGLALFAYIEASPVNFPEEEDSQLSIATKDDAEIAAIEGTPLSVFSDFCLSARDKVYTDITNKADALSSRVYNMFFQSAGTITSEALDVSRTGAERLSAQLADPSAAIAEPSNEAEKIIAEGQQNIQNVPTQPLALIEAFKTTVRAVAKAVDNQLASRLDSLKKLADVGTVISTLQNVCASIEQYEKQNEEAFNQAKSELVNVDPKLAFVELSQIPCVTTRRVTRLDSFCKFVVMSKDPIKKMASTFVRSQ